MQLVGTSIFELQEKRNFRNIQPACGGPFIRIDESALRQLEMQIREGVNAIRGRGVEIGGLIVGALADWNSAEVLITEFVPVEIEYRFGPTFRASPNDAETFRKVAAEANETAEIPGTRVIGYYRSQLRDEFSLREEDRRLISLLFPDGDCCLASIVADAYTASAMDLHRVQGGAAPVLVAGFPVKSSQSLSIAATLPVKEVQPLPPSPPPEVFAPTAAESEIRPIAAAARNRSEYLWLITTVIAALAFGSAYIVRKASVQKSAAIAQSTTAAVVEPKFETKVVTPELQRAKPTPAPRLVARTSKDTRSTNQAKAKPATAKIPAIPLANPAGEAAVIPAEPARAVVPPERPEPAPALSELQPSSPQLLSPQLPSPQLASPPVPASPPPPPGPDQATAVHRFTAPRILHQVVPAVPLGVAPGILAEVQLDVRVTVDAAGKVADARVVGSRGGAAGLLTIPTLKAAQLYRFAPAEEDGRPIAGSMVLTFRFARKPN